MNNCYSYLTITNFMSHYVTNEHSGPEFPCGICNKNVLDNAIECCLCNKWIHAKCGNLRATGLK